MKRLDNTFSGEEIRGVFEFIDVDHSKTIEFDELNSYYCKVNGIPETLELPPDYYQKAKKKYWYHYIIQRFSTQDGFGVQFEHLIRISIKG